MLGGKLKALAPIRSYFYFQVCIQRGDLRCERHRRHCDPLPPPLAEGPAGVRPRSWLRASWALRRASISARTNFSIAVGSCAASVPSTRIRLLTLRHRQNGVWGGGVCFTAAGASMPGSARAQKVRLGGIIITSREISVAFDMIFFFAEKNIISAIAPSELAFLFGNLSSFLCFSSFE